MNLRRHILPALAALALASCSDTLPYQPVTADEADGARLILTVDAYGLPSAASLSASRANDLFSAVNEKDKETPQANEQAISDAVLVIYPYSLNDNEHLSAKVTDALYFTFPDDAEHKPVVNGLCQYTSNTLNISGGFDDDTQYYCFAIANCGDITNDIKNYTDPTTNETSSRTLLQLYNYIVNCAPYTAGSNIKGFSKFVMSSVDEDMLKFHRMGDGTFKFVTHYNESTNTWEEKAIKVQRLASRVEFSFGGLETSLYNDEAGYGFVNGSTQYSYLSGVTTTTETITNQYVHVTNWNYNSTENWHTQLNMHFATPLDAGNYTLTFKVRGSVDGGDRSIQTAWDLTWQDGDNTINGSTWPWEVENGDNKNYIVTKDWRTVQVNLTLPTNGQANNQDVTIPNTAKVTQINVLISGYNQGEGGFIDFDDFTLVKQGNSTNLISDNESNFESKTENASVPTTGNDLWYHSGSNAGTAIFKKDSKDVTTTSGGTQATGTFTGKGIIYPVLNEAGTGFTQDKFLLTKVSVKNVVVPNYTHGGGTYALLHRASNVYYVDGVRHVDSPSLFGLVGFNSSGYPTSWAYCPEPHAATSPATGYTDYTWTDGHAMDFTAASGAADYVALNVSGNDVSFTDANYFTSYYTGTMPNNRILYPKAQAKYYVLDYLQENVPSTQNFTYLEIEGEYLKGGMAATDDNRKSIQAQTLFLRHYANAQKPSEGVMEYGVVRNTIYRLSFRVYSNNKKAAIRWYYYAGESNGSNGYGFNNGTKPSETDYWPTDNYLNGKPKPGDQGSHDVTIYEATGTNAPND